MRRFTNVLHIAALLFCIAALLFTVVAARSQKALPIQKLDPVLKVLVLSQDFSDATRAPALHSHKPGFINAMVKVSGSPTIIRTVGVRVRTVAGNIVTADVPLGALSRLIELPNVVYVQAARPMQPTLLDVSVPDIGADQVWQSVPGYTGKGVIIGVIDGGIDWTHPDFENGDGTSRILYIWDQMVQTPGQSPEGYEYGTQWTRDHIDSGRCGEMDPSGHGTHVASIAAGNSQGNHRLNGVAPGADIIAVKSNFQTPDVLDAVNYIFSKASEMSRPAVINISFGGQWGPHDGTSMLDQGIDALLGQTGRSVVAGAGNAGAGTGHVGTSSLRQSVGENYPWMAIRPSVGKQSVLVQIWYPPGEFLSVRVLLPESEEGDLKDLGMEWVSKGRFRTFSVPDGPLEGAEIIVDAQLIASEFLFPNFNSVYIHISDKGDLHIPIDDYLYAIECNGAGVSIDAYVVSEGKFITDIPSSVSTPDRSLLLEGDGEKTIISPASAASVICVGSYATKAEWVDLQNRLRTEDLTIDDISAFSSRGPLLNGERKPDIAAPGEMIEAALSADSWLALDDERQHIIWGGTSMAAPHVTGAVALMYEQNPRLTAYRVKFMLTRTAVDRGKPGWDEIWGYGKLDVPAAMGIPSVPRGVTVNEDNGSVSVAWAPSEEDDIAGYNVKVIYRLPGIGLQDQVFDVPHPTSSHQITGVPEDIPLSISINAYDSDGNKSPTSQEIIITLNGGARDITPPLAPTNLTILPLDTALKLIWESSNECDLAGYKIYYGASSGNYDTSVEVDKATNYTLEDLPNDVTLYIAVSAFDSSGNESEKSQEGSATPNPRSVYKLQVQDGWPVSADHDVYSSPALYDVDGDGTLEVAIASRDGKVYLLRHDGRNMAGWPITTDYRSVSSPAVGDVDSDGRIEVVVGAGRMVYMWHSDGLLAQGWPVEMEGNTIASPALGDIDSDGTMEIVIGSRDHNLYAYNADGTLVDGWPVKMYGEVNCSVALGDIDGDPGMEIVVGSAVGNVYILRGNGERVNGWPVYVDAEVYSSPVLGDIDGDGSLDVVAAGKDGRAHLWDRNGALMQGWPVELRGEIASSPVVGNMDDDENTLEIVIGNQSGLLYVLRSDGSTVEGWPVSIMDMTSSPALVDMDNDGSVEVIITAGTGRDYTGIIYALGKDGVRFGSAWPAHTQGNIDYSSPALGDLDNDGDVELVVGSCRASGGGKIHVWDLDYNVEEGAIIWGGFRHDSLHTGTIAALGRQADSKSDEEPTQELVPPKHELLANYPNPFREGTWIPYNLSKEAHVVVRIYSMPGRLVKTFDLGYQNAGYYTTSERSVRWDGRSENGERVSSGVYFYQLTADSFRKIRKMVIKS